MSDEIIFKRNDETLSRNWDYKYIHYSECDNPDCKQGRIYKGGYGFHGGNYHQCLNCMAEYKIATRDRSYYDDRAKDLLDEISVLQTKTMQKYRDSGLAFWVANYDKVIKIIEWADLYTKGKLRGKKTAEAFIKECVQLFFKKKSTKSAGVIWDSILIDELYYDHPLVKEYRMCLRVVWGADLPNNSWVRV